MVKIFKSSVVIGFAVAAVLVAVLSACSEQKLSEIDPQEARKQLTETGYEINQNGFRQAVDRLDVTAAQMFIAAGFDINAMADALAYPVEGNSRYHQPKMPAFLAEHYQDDSFRKILISMFENGFSPAEPVFAYDGGGAFPYYTTNLMAEALRLGDGEFVSFLRGYDADFSVSPGCFQRRPDCSVSGSLAGWMFYMPRRNLKNDIWSLGEALAAYRMMEEQGLLATTQEMDGESRKDPYLAASIAYQKFFWAPDNVQVDALWQQLGKPRPILPYGMRWKMADPKERRNIAGSRDFQDYLVKKAFPCLDSRDYVDCVESPPPAR